MGSNENFQENLKKVARTAKKLLKNPITRKVIIVICAIAAIIILCGSAYDTLTEAFSDTISEQVKKSPAVSYSSTDGSIELEEQGIDDLIKVIKDMGIDLTDLNLSRDDVKKLYMAEVVSSEINRNVTETAGKYYGRVFIKKQNSSGELQALSYEPLESFEKMDATEILNHFSIEDDKICIASINSTTDENGNEVKTPTINKISYKDTISQYMVPVEFLLNLCFITQNSGFVLEFADKIINETEIVIEVLQEQTVTNITETTTYKEETETSTKTRKYDSVGNYISTSINTPDPTVTGPHTATETQSQTTIRSSLKIRSVKNWIVEEEHTYNKTTNTNTNEVGPIEIDDEEKGTHRYQNETREDLDDGGYNLNSTSTIKRKIEQTQIVKTEATSDTYQEGVSEGIKDKVDEFITMLKTPYPQKNSGAKRSAIGNLENGAEMFFNMLKNGSRTQGLEELMRYILGKATGKSYGVDEFDFSIFNIREFKSTALSAQNLADYLRQFSHSGEAPQSADGKYYLMYGDGVGWPTIGNADLQWKSHHGKFNVEGSVLENGVEKLVPNIEEYVNGYLTKGVDAKYTNDEVNKMQIYIEKSVVDDIGNNVQKTYYDSVVNLTQGISLSKQQLYALTAIIYNFGNLPERNGYTFKEVYEAGAAQYEIDSWEHNRFIWDNWWCQLGGGSAGNIPSRDAAFQTYVKGVYKFSESDAGPVFGRNYYIYYTQEQLNKFSYAPNKSITRTPANEEEIFTSEGGFDGETILAAGYEFPHYHQNQYTQSYGTTGGTISSSGCGPTSLAMVLAGLKNDYSITPDTVVANIKEHWPDGSYYVPGVGSSHCIFGSTAKGQEFLKKYYGVTSKYVSSRSEGIQALENGYSIIGGEEGHLLAIVPAPEEYKAQGYKFYIIDSARGHSGAYRTAEEADKVVKGNLGFNYIIMPE